MEIKPKEKKSNKIIMGIILIIFGLLLLEDSYQIEISDQLFPLILIGIGVFLMVRKRNKEMRNSADAQSEKFDNTMDNVYNKVNDFESKAKKHTHNFEEKFDKHINKFDQKIEQFDKKISDFDRKFKSGFTDTSHKNGKVKYEKAFGDLFINCKGINVENVEVSSAIGDIEIQMREAVFAEGLNRLIISNFIGNVNIYLPKELATFVNCSNFIGDIEAVGKRSTGFGNKVESHSQDYDTAPKKLYIACNSFIGDILIIAT